MKKKILITCDESDLDYVKRQLDAANIYEIADSVDVIEELKVWIAQWHDTGSYQTEIIGVFSGEIKAEDAIEDYHMNSKDCSAEEFEVQ